MKAMNLTGEVILVEPAAYLTVGGTVVQVISQGCAIAQESIARDGEAKMLAFLKRHWPEVTPTMWAVEENVGMFYVIEED